jgi:hypothetical protein
LIFQYICIILADLRFTEPIIPLLDNEFQNEPFKIIQTLNGRQVIADTSGFRYSYSRKQKKRGTESWRCSSTKSRNCKVYILTIDGVIVSKKNDHTHEPPYKVPE